MLQKEAKENPGTPADLDSKLPSASSSAAHSELGSPRLTLSPRLPSTSINTASNSARNLNDVNSSINKRRLQTGLLQQLDVSRSLPGTPETGAYQSEPTSPTGSVASVASIASETALHRRQTGLSLTF